MTHKRRNAIPATAAARSFGTLLDRVRESGSVYQVESHGQVVAEIGPAPRHFTLGDWRTLVAREPHAPAELVDAIEAARRDDSPQEPERVAPLSGRGGRRRR
jgi:antitoxin (DNA-binding transcriptional repressor) of toxin-antitoxin stability system